MLGSVQDSGNRHSRPTASGGLHHTVISATNISRGVAPLYSHRHVTVIIVQVNVSKQGHDIDTGATEVRAAKYSDQPLSWAAKLRS